MKTILMIVLPLVVMLNACTKNTINTNKPAIPVTGESLAATIEDPANKANPYDSIGAGHNVMLDRLISGTTAKPDTSLQYITGQVSKYLPLNSTTVPGALLAAARRAINDSPDHYIGLIDDCNISNTARTYLHQLMGLLLDSANYKQGDMLSFSVLKNHLTQFEERVIGDRQLATKDKAAVLAVSSVSRYSAYYWNFRVPQTAIFKKIIRRIAVITGDAGGAISGLFNGDIIGTAASDSDWWYNYITYGMP